MADLIIRKPGAGETVNIDAEGATRLILEPAVLNAESGRDGEALVYTFNDDGAVLRIADFFNTYSDGNYPAFQVDGEDQAGHEYLSEALGEELAEPAAGPEAGADPQRGGRFNEHGNSQLGGGIDHLGRLDYESGRNFDWEQPSWITAPDSESGAPSYGLPAQIPPAGLPQHPDAIAPDRPSHPDSSPGGVTPNRPGGINRPAAPDNSAPEVVVPPAGDLEGSAAQLRQQAQTDRRALPRRALRSGLKAQASRKPPMLQPILHPVQASSMPAAALS